MRIANKLGISISLIVLFSSLGFCAEIAQKEQAQEYRQRGLDLQKIGDLDRAISFYQKAIELDPSYITAYNDLGIIYENKGWLDRAEDMYLKGLKIDPYYLNLYSNLAMLYERKQDYYNAAMCWKKRRDLGNPNESWTQKAQERLDNLSEIVPELKREMLEAKAADLSKDLIYERRQKELAKINEAKKYFDLGFADFQNQNYHSAVEGFTKSLTLNPEDTNTKQFLAKAKKFDAEAQIKLHCEKGLKSYQQDDAYSAIQEFDKILSLISEQPNMESR